MTEAVWWCPAFVAAALAVLWWPASRVEHRLSVHVDAAPRARSVDVRAVLIAAIPLAALMIGGVAAGVAATIVVSVIWWRRRRRAAERAVEARIDDMVRALSTITAEMSVGTPPTRACLVAVSELRIGVGRSEVADGLEAMACRAELGGAVVDPLPAGDAAWGPVSWQRVGVAWQTSERHGLPMADLLGALRSDLLARRAFIDRTRAGLAGPRATAVVLAGLPVLGIALGQATGARPLQVLSGGGLGGILLVVGTGLVAAGLVWAERLTARVLTP
ncbi:type II secretion system protein F [Gordonia sp. ABSL49_1]|uniref:type II secretion system F family protein n=1 Tax=unclassified Gordonia (in: high G+C Gram-positive bacteria) TaxID=2657482 RepID=UPI001F0CEBA4|nr:type II secretion system protein F [Gordonia sp. ABSL49_1]MCH5641680.1 type II secretion system protein F [Gordonia sp. ABSL49_1]